MHLGIVITNEHYADQALGLVQAAAGRGWSVRCFLTDSGVRLLNHRQFADVCRHDCVAVSLCEHSMAHHGGETLLGDLAAHVLVGGQFQDAELVRHSDKVLVF